MRILLGLALAAVVLSGCGPQEPEGLANSAKAPAATETKGSETETPKPSTPAPQTAGSPSGESNPAEVDKVPEKPLPGPGAAPTLDK